MPKGVENPSIILKTTGLRVYFDDTTGPSIHINAHGNVWLDSPGSKGPRGTHLANLKK
jgi:hypothetical protein